MQNEIKQTQLIKTDSKNRYEKLGMKTTRGNFCVGFLFVVVLLITYWFASDQWKLHVEKGKMLAYLQEKYGKEFVVEDIYTSRKGLGFPLEVNAQVHPVDAKDAIFSVNKELEGERSGEKAYLDGYLGRLWSQQEGFVVRNYFKASSLDAAKIEVDVGIDFETEKKIKKGETVTFSEALKKYGINMSCGLTVRVDGDFNETTKIKYASQVMEMIGFFRENSDIGKPYIRYFVNTEHKEGRTFVGYFCGLSPEQIKRIDKLEDIFPLFKKFAF